MQKLNLSFSDAKFMRPTLRDVYDLLLGVEAVLVLSVAGRPIYTETMFPIIELRAALAAWLPVTTTDFEFESMESDERGLVWLRRQPSGLWRAGSIHQDDATPVELTAAEVTTSCKQFIAAVDEWARESLNLDVTDFLSR